MAEFEAIFVDVGEGDSTLFKLPGDQYMLVDVFRCEDHGTVDLHRLLDDRLPMGSSGKPRLEYLVITHAHDDHIRGLGELYDRYEVGELWLPQHGYKKAPGDQYSEFERVVKAHPDSATEYPQGSRTPWTSIGEGGQVSVRCFSPPGYINVSEKLDEDEATRLVHENCMVLKVEYRGHSVLLTGDSNLPCWQRVHGYYEGRTGDDGLEVLKTTVLHASHHGSRTFVKDRKEDAAWVEALEVIDQEVVVVSVGKDNKHDHPHDDMMRVYRDQVSDGNVLETQREETLVFSVDANGTASGPATDESFASQYGWQDDDEDDQGGDARSGPGGPGGGGGLKTNAPPVPPARPRPRPEPDRGRNYG
ncbi:MAG: competence protein ComEC [Solirubrobacteraceae bacterium]|jgi:beta-lactamase superfamily II metal-dependent hydrolase|nr:competence protein ComEC [Solirubrobacteraceae bacterium]